MLASEDDLFGNAFSFFLCSRLLECHERMNKTMSECRDEWRDEENENENTRFRSCHVHSARHTTRDYRKTYIKS